MGQGMADGGIVAFSGEVDSFVEEREDRRTPFDIMLGNRYRPPRNQPVTPDPTNRNIDMVTGAISTGAIPFVDANLDNQMFANIDRDVGASSPGAAPPPKTGADQTGGAPRGTAPGVAPSAVPTFESRRSAIDQLLAPTEDIAKQVAASKNQAQGEFLMQMGAALMSTPNVGVALSKGVAAGLPGLAANRKEINAIQKDQRDYRLNLSKAQEAAAQGRDDLAFKYADLAEKAKYHAGIVASRAGGGDRFTTAAMAQARAQLTAAMKDPRQSRSLATPEAQSTYLNNAFNSALSILTGQGPVTPSIPTYGALPSGEAPLTR
jgi:hypothetical protein